MPGPALNFILPKKTTSCKSASRVTVGGLIPPQQSAKRVQRKRERLQERSSGRLVAASSICGTSAKPCCYGMQHRDRDLTATFWLMALGFWRRPRDERKDTIHCVLPRAKVEADMERRGRLQVIESDFRTTNGFGRWAAHYGRRTQHATSRWARPFAAHLKQHLGEAYHSE